MRAIGKSLCLLAMLLLTLPLRAEVTASVDRDRVALGDTMRLTITATDGEETSNTDLRPLLEDFEILQRSTSSSTSITNGRRTHTKQILLDITPRRQGTLKIPSLQVGRGKTNMLLVAVGPPPDSNSAGESVIFEAEVDRENVYVQGQLILTLRIQQAINLDNRGISELELDNAFIKPLEQQSFQRNIDGRPWLVHEIRYAIFPEQSGILEIPAQTFSARESLPRRSMFDINRGGRQLRRSTEALRIEVLPRPAEFPDTNWLPARSISVEERWSTPPEQLKAGESATRTITVRGEGVQGAQLPPVLFPSTEGLKYYPDQPVINDGEVSTGLMGSRQDSAALVPTRAGDWTIPELRIPWWDTEKGELRYAVIPQRVISVAAAESSPATDTAGSAASLNAPADTINLPGVTTHEQDKTWKLVAAVSTAGWLLTIAILLWSRHRDTHREAGSADDPNEREAFKKLLAACADDQPADARQSVIDWCSALLPDTPIHSLSQAAVAMADTDFDSELAQLNRILYGTAGEPWKGNTLAGLARKLRGKKQRNAQGDARQLELYPATAQG